MQNIYYEIEIHKRKKTLMEISLVRFIYLFLVSLYVYQNRIRLEHKYFEKNTLHFRDHFGLLISVAKNSFCTLFYAIISSRCLPPRNPCRGTW